jgi:hypothetical protein
MKFLLLSFLLASFSSFAQDGYHSEPETPTCSRSTCLINNNGVEIGFYETEDIDGYKSMLLNTSSSILDIDLSRFCFTGSQDETLLILSALAGNTNADYYNGGHAMIIDSVNAKVSENMIEKLLVYVDDYESSNKNLAVLIKRCNSL